MPNSSLTTHVSLLSRLRDTSNHRAWSEFQHRYQELLGRYCRRRGLQAADAEDVVQTVFMNLSKSLPQFVYDPNRGRFRDYLYRCTKNALAEWSRRRNLRPEALDTSAVAAADDPADTTLWRDEWVAHHYRLAFERIRTDFDARNVEIFERNLNGESIAELARAYQVNEDAIYATRRRIRTRLQELIAAQVQEEDQIDGDGSRPKPVA
ncbi:MAG: hypothetical protein CHACPFDD_03877 [Phycisphaerae bacterium]|nr:hypothetical protein [Phycisphaerae bacterium]